MSDEPRKKKKRRGQDPRLDALAAELAKDDAEGGGDHSEGPGPGVIVAGGVDVARVHVTGIAPPGEADHATLPMKKVMIGAGAPARGGRSGSSRAIWKAVALAAAAVALASLGAAVWALTWKRQNEGEAGVTREIRGDTERSAPIQGIRESSVPRVEVMPSASPSISADGCMEACSPPAAAVSGARPAVRPSSWPAEVPAGPGPGLPSPAPSSAPNSEPVGLPSSAGSSEGRGLEPISNPEF